ncbi:MAG: hypothetical protein ABI619_12595 [Betaproteobacteria bacterium]
MLAREFHSTLAQRQAVIRFHKIRQDEKSVAAIRIDLRAAQELRHGVISEPLMSSCPKDDGARRRVDVELPGTHRFEPFHRLHHAAECEEMRLNQALRERTRTQTHDAGKDFVNRFHEALEAAERSRIREQRTE